MRAPSVILPANASREAAIDRLLNAAMNLPLEKPWKFTWQVDREARSDKQNNALWGCAYAFLEEETGNDPEEMHEYFCGEYFGWVTKEVFGKKKLKPRRTTTRDENGDKDIISTLHFMQFYEFIQRRIATTIGLSVPDPDPHWRDNQEAA